MDAHVSDDDNKQYAPIRYTTPEENKQEEEKPRQKLVKKSSLRKAATPTLRKNVSFNQEVEIKTDDLDTVIVQVP